MTKQTAETEQANQTNTSLIAKDISYIQKDMGEIKASIKELAGVYVTKIQYEDTQRGFEMRLQGMEKIKNSAWSWLTPVLTVVFSSVIASLLTFLIISYLQHAK